jgi:hypothetical protein
MSPEKIAELRRRQQEARAVEERYKLFSNMNSTDFGELLDHIESLQKELAETKKEVEQHSHAADLYMIGESRAERERDEARTALGAAVELLRMAESSQCDPAWWKAVEELVDEHGCDHE